MGSVSFVGMRFRVVNNSPRRRTRISFWSLSKIESKYLQILPIYDSANPFPAWSGSGVSYLLEWCRELNIFPASLVIDRMHLFHIRSGLTLSSNRCSRHGVSMRVPVHHNRRKFRIHNDDICKEYLWEIILKNAVSNAVQKVEKKTRLIK